MTSSASARSPVPYATVAVQTVQSLRLVQVVQRFGLFKSSRLNRSKGIEHGRELALFENSRKVEELTTSISLRRRIGASSLI